MFGYGLSMSWKDLFDIVVIILFITYHFIFDNENILKYLLAIHAFYLVKYPIMSFDHSYWIILLHFIEV